MTQRYNQDELWELIRYAVGLEHPKLREAPMNLVVRNNESHGPTVVGLIVAEPGEDIDELAQKAAE